jgi:hypothetical protein
MCSILRSWDPMVEEETLGASVGAPCRSYLKELVSMVEQPANPLPTTLSSCLSNLPLIEDVQTPVMFRTEEEQLVGHELIKALRNFKLSPVSPLSPSNRHESSSNNEAIVVHPKRTQSCYPQRKIKFKSKKPGFKVLWDLLTKKWIDQQLCDLFHMVLRRTMMQWALSSSGMPIFNCQIMEELGNNLLLVYDCIVKNFVQYYNASCVGWWNHAQFIKQC